MPKQMNLVQFADIISSTWRSKLCKIKLIKNSPGYQPKTDYYKQIREYIIKFHESGKPLDQFDDATTIVSNNRKQKTYTPLVQAYKAFLKDSKTYRYFKSQRGILLFNDLHIVANPEIGLEIDGIEYLIKLYFKVDTLTKQDAEIITCVMENALRKSVDSSIKMAVLDVLRSKLFIAAPPTPDTILTIHAEAKYISDMWDNL